MDTNSVFLEIHITESVGSVPCVYQSIFSCIYTIVSRVKIVICISAMRTFRTRFYYNVSLICFFVCHLHHHSLSCSTIGIKNNAERSIAPAQPRIAKINCPLHIHKSFPIVKPSPVLIIVHCHRPSIFSHSFHCEVFEGVLEQNSSLV